MGYLILLGYVVLAVVLWPWGLLAGALHLLVLALCVPWWKR